MPTLRNSLAAADISHHLHPRTNWRTHEAIGPQIITRGDGAEIEDDQWSRCNRPRAALPIIGHQWNR